MRILIADKLAPSAPAALTEAGHDVIVDPSLGGEALADALRDHAPDALVVRSTKVTADHVDAAPTLGLVVRAGAGVNTIDLAAAGERGVFVANCPGKNAVAVAELTFALLLAIDRRIADGVIDARAGRWNKAGQATGRGLKGRTLGLLGMGRIGRAVAARARAFEMDVVAWSRSLTPAEAEALGVRWAASPADVAAGADVLSLHLALTEGTRGLVDAAMLATTPADGILLNTSRAGVVDEDALLAALEGSDRWAGLDVLASEPSGKTGTFDDPLAKHPRVVLSHHVGASTTEAQEAVAAEAVRVLLGYAGTGRAPNVVNLVTRSAATHVLVVRHHDRVGVLAGVLDELQAADLNVQEMENALFDGPGAAVARIHVHGDPSAVIDALQALPHVLHVTHAPLPEAP